MFKVTTNVMMLFACTLSQAMTCYAGSYETMSHLNALASDFITKNVSVDPDERIDVKLSEACRRLATSYLHPPDCHQPA